MTTAMTVPTDLPTDNPPVGGKNDIMRSVDTGPLAMYLDRTLFEQAWSAAGMLAKSTIIPDHYQNNASNCFIAVQLAGRLGVDPFMLMQNSHVIHGKPGFESKFVIALINNSGLFVDPLEYEFTGKPRTPEWRVRVSAVRAGTGKPVAIDFEYKTALDEGWVSKSGSKWKTMPDQMMRYRGAAFFARVICPEVMLGLQTTDELEDIAPLEARVVTFNPDDRPKSERLLEKIRGDEPKPEPEAPADPQEKPQAPTEPEAPIETEAKVVKSEGVSASDAICETICEKADCGVDDAMGYFEMWCRENDDVTPSQLDELSLGDESFKKILKRVKSVRNWKLYKPG